MAHPADLRIKPAVESLDELLDAGLEGTVDFAFIDADKPGYDSYYERLLKLLRVGASRGVCRAPPLLRLCPSSSLVRHDLAPFRWRHCH